MTPDFRRELLDPGAWQEGLEKYALAMRLAVILVDADGRPLSSCLNPQPLWSLLRAGRPAGAGECPFALAPLRPCTCAADALQKGEVGRARDRTGLVHFVVPLALDETPLGALIAGQVFDQYPEQLALETVARELDLSPAKVWQQARREHPVSPSTLRVYEDLLTTLGHTFLLGRYHTLQDASRLTQLRQAEEALREANNALERRVEERTAELQEAQEKALQAERLAAIGQVVTGLAHESRNALQRSQACLSVLALRLKENQEDLALIGRLQKAQDDLLRLFNEVQHFAAPVRLEPRPCNLVELWREAWADLVTARDGKETELREETGGTDLRCTVSPFHLRQVFRNLLDNALNVGADPVRIEIRCSEAKIEGREVLQVVVHDNGPGFGAEAKEKAFEPFFTTKVKGTGLGLPICKRIIEAHGGRIAVSGGEPGASILVTLPRRTP